MRKTLGSKVLVPDIELRRPVPHGTAFRGYEWRGYVPTFKAIVVDKSDGGQKVHLTDFDEADLMDGDVTVRVEWSTGNYKDGLALTGKAPVVRRSPIIAGIDSTGRPAEADDLRALGAREIIERKELVGVAKPLGREQWAGGIDTVGSTTLANVLSMTRYGGAVAACGLAGGMDLPATVAPFILRGVSLVGIDSVMCPLERRREAWKRLASDMEAGKLAPRTRGVDMSGVMEVGRRIVEGGVRGRVVVKIG